MSTSYYMDRFVKIAIPALIMVAVGAILYMIAYIFLCAMMSSAPSVNVGVILIGVSGILLPVVYMIAGFMSIVVVKSMGSRGWQPLILSTSTLFFIHALLFVIGVYVSGIAGLLGGYSIIYTVASVFILIIAALILMRISSSLVNGILLLIASILMIIAITNIGGFFQMTQMVLYIFSGISLRLEFTPGLLLPISLVIVSVGLVIYEFIKRKPILYTILAVAAITFSIDFILKFMNIPSRADLLSKLPSDMRGASDYLYGFGISALLGDVFYGIAGILGLIALILLLVVVVKSFMQPVAVTPTVTPPPQPTAPAPTPPAPAVPAANIMEEIKRIESILRSLDEKLIMGQISEQTYRELKEKYTARLEELKKQLSGGT